jgi:2-alkyl-3-oxoalkanoate reductase
MRIFLTGGTGLLGSHFAETAVSAGDEVVALVRPTSDTEHLKSLGVRQVVGDIHDLNSLSAGMRGCEAVVHTAYPLGGWRRPELYQLGIIEATQNVLSAMGAAHVTRLVYLSTIAVHGLDPTRGKPIGEEDGFGRHFLTYDHYGRAKAASERLIQSSYQEKGLIQATVFRPGWMYGARDIRSYGLMAGWMERGLAFRIGKGDNILPLVFAPNAALALYKCLTQGPAGYRPYLCSSDDLVTQNDYLTSLARATGVSKDPITFSKSFLLLMTHLNENLAKFSGYRLRVFTTTFFVHLFGSSWCFNQQRIRDELGYSPKTDYTSGFAVTEAWYRQYQTGKYRAWKK